MSNEDVTMKLRLLDEFSATTKKYLDEMKKMKGSSDEATKGISLGFDNIKQSIQSAGAALAASAILAWFKGAMDEAAGAEKAVRDLNSALKVSGQYSADASDSMQSWAGEMQNATGIADDLVLKVSAIGLRMGWNIEQTQAYTKATLDLGTKFGDVEGAARALQMASEGQTRGLKQYGIFIDEAKVKTEGFGSVLKEVNRLYGGSSKVDLDNYDSQVRLLGEHYAAFKESIGKPLLDAATSWLGVINKLIEGHKLLNQAVARDASVATKEEWGRLNLEAGAIEQSIARWRKSSWGGENDVTIKQLEDQLQKIRQRLKEITEEAKKAGQNISDFTGQTAPPPKFEPPKKSQDEIDREKKRLAEEKQRLEDLRYAAAQQAIADNTEQLRNYFELDNLLQKERLTKAEEARKLELQLWKERKEGARQAVTEEIEAENAVRKLREENEKKQQELAIANGKYQRSVLESHKASSMLTSGIRTATAAITEQIQALALQDAALNRSSYASSLMTQVQKSLLEADFSKLSKSDIKEASQLYDKAKSLADRRATATAEYQQALGNDPAGVQRALKELESIQTEESQMAIEFRDEQRKKFGADAVIPKAAEDTQTNTKNTAESVKQVASDTGEINSATSGIKAAVTLQTTATTAAATATTAMSANITRQTGFLDLIERWTWATSYYLKYLDDYLVPTMTASQLEPSSRSGQYVPPDYPYTLPTQPAMYDVPVSKSGTPGTSQINITVNGAIGDTRDIAKRIDSELKTARRYREVA